MRLLVDQDVTGLLTPTRDGAALQRAMTRLVEDEVGRDPMAAAGAVRARDFERDAVIAVVEAFSDEISRKFSA
jgi:hypothetical protein